jgi:cytochrome P450
MREFANPQTAPDPGPVVVTGWGRCRKLLSDTELVSDPSLAGLATDPTNNLLLMEGELHQRLRKLISPYFVRSRIESMGGQLEATCDRLVASLLVKPDADLVTDLAEPLVLEGILSAMDVPSARREKLGELARGMLELLEPDQASAARRRAASALRATMLFERDGLAGSATGLHATLEAAARDGLIPVKLARSTPVVVLHGGYENPLNQLGCLIAWAAADPERFRHAAVSAPVVLFEEVMRVFSPVRRVARWATLDRVGDHPPLRRGAFVWVDLESANRDERRFSASREVDLSKRQGHVGFGYGRHACPGAALARLEGQVLIRSLLTMPDDVLTASTITWREGVVAQGPMKILRR